MFSNNSDNEQQMIREAQNEARKQKIKYIWNKYQKLFIAGGALLAMVLVVYVMFYFYHRDLEKQYSANLHQLFVDFSEGKKDQAVAGLKKITEDKKAPQGVKSIAALRYAAILLGQNQTDQAVAIYLQINREAGDSYIRELGGLLAVKTLVDSNDPKYYPQIVELNTKLQKNSKILHAFLLEQQAFFEWGRGNVKLASEILTKISKDQTATDALNRRTAQMLQIINSKLSVTPATKRIADPNPKAQ